MAVLIKWTKFRLTLRRREMRKTWSGGVALGHPLTNAPLGPCRLFLSYACREFAPVDRNRRQASQHGRLPLLPARLNPENMLGRPCVPTGKLLPHPDPPIDFPF